MITLDSQAIIRRLCEKVADVQALQSSQEIEIVTAPIDTKPPLHALVIGINQYKTNVHLAAAVADALAFREYLIDDLRVPEEQITTLLDEQAGRADIIKAFQNLAKPDNGIEHGDPIVIYYAGHSSKVDPPLERAADEPVLCIVPQDTDEADEVVPIPYFTIASLVHRIAQEKGNNITLIFDCSRSAASRDGSERSRFIDKADLPKLRPMQDIDIIQDELSGSSDLSDPTKFGLSLEDMDSHVMLAACGHGEVAFENGTEKYGYFTNALLKLLRSVKVDSLTYRGCAQRLPPLCTRQPQNPVCEGKNIHRIFFNAMVPGAKVSFIAVKLNESNEPCLQAGLMQGITPGSRFSIHESDTPGPTNPSIGTLEVDKVDLFTACLKDMDTGAQLPAACYGRQISYGPEQVLDIFVTQEFVDAAEPDEAWARAFSGNKERFILRPVERDLAAVVLSVNAEKKTTFTLNHPLSVQYGVQTLPTFTNSPIPPVASYVIPILTALSQWNWHLRHTPDSRLFYRQIDLEFYKLELTGEYDDMGNPLFAPIGENLNFGGVVNVVASTEDYYGLRVMNRSAQDLYVYPFDFSATGLDIVYRPIPILDSSAFGPHLLKDEALTIGYGAGGQYPFMFAIDEPLKFDITMLKLFVSTTPTDVQSLEQGGVFGERHVALDGVISDPFKESVWDALTLMLVQRQPHVGEEPAPPQQLENATTESLESRIISLQSLEVEANDISVSALGASLMTTSTIVDQPSFAGRSDEPMLAQARSATAVTSVWFRTPELTQELLSSIHCMRLRTLAKQQAPAGADTTEQTGAYFEISVISSLDGLPKLMPSDTEMTYRSHSAPATPEYEWTDGPIFDETHEMWSNLEVGDCFEVVVCASGRGRVNDANQGSLTFW
ncbi:DNA-directed RNA polymerase subunit beta'' [Rhizoctonia solani]|uniref:DNA-directed RNA polymerase subunit beta n=1 Tax=Rhizoctonia solani TaxID=456999 RepID=A0A0K6GF54_9AGAM|nr:DNA-directed RNA polymerase subunit beta'' [Rhizoctonia solani]